MTRVVDHRESPRVTRGATVAPMSSHALAGPPPTFDLEKRAEHDGTAVRGGTVFHNFAITMQVSGSVGASHQVLRIPAPNDLRAVVEHQRRTASTLGARLRLLIAASS